MAAWSDEDMLHALDLHERGGLSAGAIASMFGCTRSAFLGMKKRVFDELERSEAGDADPARHDGTMEPGWWRTGLDARGGAS